MWKVPGLYSGSYSAPVLIITALIAWIIWIIIRDFFFNPLKEIPSAPDSHPIFKHLLVFRKQKDLGKIFKRWCKYFKDVGLFRYNHLVGKLEAVKALFNSVNLFHHFV